MTANPKTFAVLLVCAFAVSPAYAQVRLGPNGPYTVTKPESTTKPKKKTAPRRRVENPDEPQTFRLSISPAAEPDLPLKYSLLPAYDKVKPGNSVPFYLRAILSSKERPKSILKRYNDNYDRWMQGPPSKMPKEEVREYLRSAQGAFRELKIATHREKTDWSWRLQDLDGLKAIAFLLPEIQESRELARLLVLKIRLEIAERRFDDAIASLQMGYQLARDVAEPPTLINALVGVAIASLLDQELIYLIESPGSPNMYWALSRLPTPFIDLRKALQYEMTLPAKIFPSLKEAETGNHTPAEWARLLTEGFRKMAKVDGGIGFPNSKVALNFGSTAFVLMGYPRAKRELVALGYDRKRLEAMPVGQVIAIHQARVYKYMYQQLLKWSHLPPHQAIAGTRRAEQKLKREGYFGPIGKGREIIPLAALLLPGVTAAQTATARLDSRTAGLQVIEAIRIHAAGNGGKLPETLADIKQVPVPKNPLTDQPFPYRLVNNKAELLIPAPPHQPANIGWRFVITVRSEK